jgi:hypothetical protein
MPKWHVRRARHATWPQPTGPPATTILRRQLNGIALRPERVDDFVRSVVAGRANAEDDATK